MNQTRQEIIIKISNELIAFDDEELQTFCLTFYPDVYQNQTSGMQKGQKIRLLIDYCERNASLASLLETLSTHKKIGRDNLQTTSHSASTRLRQNFINRVRSVWVQGVLYNAVHHDIYMQLGMKYDRQAVSQLSNYRLRPDDSYVPPNTHIYNLFVAHGRNLLILGEPASGKTITLLQLAERLLTEAEQQPQAPLPVVLNLSSWQGGPLMEWLAEAMLLQYGLSREVSTEWIEQNHLIYLLDGLDEVATEQREACVTNINLFQEAHIAEVVVCSRSQDYALLQSRLHLSTAVQIDPLTTDQINNYLVKFGERTAHLRQILSHALHLQELAKSPLMLSLMVLAYNEKTLDEQATFAQQRTHLFDQYIQRVFDHRPLSSQSPYTQEQASQWLANLAAGMKQHDQSIFHIENLQKTWLPRGYSKSYQLTLCLIYGISVGLIYGLSVGQVVGQVVGLIGGSVYGLIVSLTYGLSIKHRYIKLVESLTLNPTRKSLLWSNIKEYLTGVLIVGLIVGLGVGLIYGLTVGLIAGLVAGLSFGVINEVFESIDKNPFQQLTQPNQGIQAAWGNIIIGVIVVGLITGLSVGMIVGLIVGLSIGLIYVLTVGLIVGLVTGLSFGVNRYGGGTIIKHYSLRYWLARADILPYPFQDKKLVAFLDDMVDRMILRRVGGGWIFIHRTLLEHFADKVQENPQHPTYQEAIKINQDVNEDVPLHD